jgi:hypothetical protein
LQNKWSFHLGLIGVQLAVVTLIAHKLMKIEIDFCQQRLKIIMTLGGIYIGNDLDPRMNHNDEEKLNSWSQISSSQLGTASTRTTDGNSSPST